MAKEVGQKLMDGPHRRAVGEARADLAGASRSRGQARAPVETESRCAEWNPLGAAHGGTVEGHARTVPAVRDVPPPFLRLGSRRNDAADRRDARSRFKGSRQARSRRSIRRRHLCPGEKGGGYVGETKRGKGCKIMAMVDCHGLPLAIDLESASPHESRLLESLLRQNFLRRHERPRFIIGDKAYDSDHLDARLEKR